MDLVPVIDLQSARVVRARRGERATYRPIVTPLAEGSEPVAIARALLERAGGHALYVADLDAIVHGRAQWAAIDALRAALPGVTLWLDAGFADAAAAAHALAGRDRVIPVFGSESLQATQLPRDAVLSLDRRGTRPLDPAGWWNAPERWPHTVIAMTLDAVGSEAGPDLATLAELRRRVPAGGRIVGAGGVRHEADLASAAAAGASAWLVASALHGEAIDRRSQVARA